MENEQNNQDQKMVWIPLEMYDRYRDVFINHINDYVLEDDIKIIISKYYKLLFDYNCLGGKNNRGILVILIYEYVKNRDINCNEWEKVACIEYCLEYTEMDHFVYRAPLRR
ncbi:hypothetical protein PFMG_02108 [Plasmodium falciparum IGH-CR14]|uniref:Uncharacterized protein n=1 Tax=Plasmodium falciparum IGH-CR14 TaxID=580059 RepID=A0A0L1I9K4_PLAFA|nr:hypothetical protein PFMG_02108 [Plasmodium falciparum IGH-CR14]